MKRLFYFDLGGRGSLKVRGRDKLEILKALGTAIDRMNGRPLGRFEQRPVNM
ncbi:MAG: hypothetical protein JRI36_05680 [Deltaproteobacteria bacterium]|nr:hypothetical protein [Deltaproteobacteria bacterium]